MSNELTVLDNFGPVADVFDGGPPIDNSAWTAGIGAAWPILTIKGKSFGWRYRGEEHTYSAPNAAAGGQHMPVQFLDVVLVQSGARISKVYYEVPWNPTSKERLPPTCWSADGITPDAAVSQKQANTCGGCPHNVFGSSIGPQGQRGKKCSDNKRVAVVTLNDLANQDFGGPFMLRVPPGSFANYLNYCSVMANKGYHPYMVVTRLTFDPQVPHPKIKFDPVRTLTREEAMHIIHHHKNPRVAEMLNDKAVAAFADDHSDSPAGGAADLPPATAATTGMWGGAKPNGANGHVDTSTLQTKHVQTADTPATYSSPATAPTMTPEQARILELEAKLAAAQTPEPEPEPVPVKTPEQLRIEQLEAALAEATKAKKPGRPRSKPVGPPESTVTAPGNTATPPAGDAVGNAISDRIAQVAGAAKAKA